MSRQPQKRRIETRAKLLATAYALLPEGGYGALRVEEIVQQASVAKGTFFAHFQDKETLLAEMIGNRMGEILSALEAEPEPKTATELSATLSPMLEFIGSELVVFSVVQWFANATNKDGPLEIAQCISRLADLLAVWIKRMPKDQARQDQPVELLAEGVLALANHIISVSICAPDDGGLSLSERLLPLLRAMIASPLSYSENSGST